MIMYLYTTHNPYMAVNNSFFVGDEVWYQLERPCGQPLSVHSWSHPPNSHMHMSMAVSLKAAMMWMAITKNDFLANQTVGEPSQMLKLPICQPSSMFGCQNLLLHALVAKFILASLESMLLTCRCWQVKIVILFIFYRPSVERILPAAFPNMTYTLNLTEGKSDKKTGTGAHLGPLWNSTPLINSRKVFTWN